MSTVQLIAALALIVAGLAYKAHQQAIPQPVMVLQVYAMATAAIAPLAINAAVGMVLMLIVVVAARAGSLVRPGDGTALMVVGLSTVWLAGAYGCVL